MLHLGRDRGVPAHRHGQVGQRGLGQDGQLARVRVDQSHQRVDSVLAFRALRRAWEERVAHAVPAVDVLDRLMLVQQRMVAAGVDRHARPARTLAEASDLQRVERVLDLLVEGDVAAVDRDSLDRHAGRA